MTHDSHITRPEAPIALTGRATDPRVGDAMRALAAHLGARGLAVRGSASQAAEWAGLDVELVPDADIAQGARFVVAVGGDGTMLLAARLAAIAGVPLLGINRGRVGFLADVGPERMLESVDDAIGGRCEIERRMLLNATLTNPSQPRSAQALNDVVLARRETGRMVDVRTWVDGTYVNTHSGDGFIISTSTGSTAYALSCNGPIMHPGLDALLLVPICPHTLSDRPIVVSGSARIELEVIDRDDARVQVVCDGNVMGDLQPGTRLRVERAPCAVTLLHPPGHDYFRTLRSKLHWGRGPRNGQPTED
jgi:NAD+ kinase